MSRSSRSDPGAPERMHAPGVAFSRVSFRGSQPSSEAHPSRRSPDSAGAATRRARATAYCTHAAGVALGQIAFGRDELTPEAGASGAAAGTAETAAGRPRTAAHWLD